MAKPHIAKLATTRRWRCSIGDTEAGFGDTPQQAYQHWKWSNVIRRHNRRMEGVRVQAANAAALSVFIPRMIAAFVILIALAIAAIWMMHD